MKKKQDRDKLLSLVFSKEGLLGRSLLDFEERIEQQQMARQILTAYEEEEISLIEAGTGTGKSLSYLFPAVYWALKNQEKTVIATHTISLQEQLVHKDIPFLLGMMEADLKATLVKGMGNYVCLRRLHEQLDQLLLISTEEIEQMQSVLSWVQSKQEGSFSSFPFSVSPWIRDKIGAESDSCNHVHCPHYKDCFFFKERKQAIEAQILVVNQHLLLADMQRRIRNPGQESILPAYERVVIDEAHHFEQIALESLAEKWDRIECLRYLSRLYTDTHPEKSRLLLLRRALASLSQITPSIIQQLEMDLPAHKRTCQAQLETTCTQLTQFLTLFTEDRKVRLLPAMCAHPQWKTIVVPTVHSLSDLLRQLSLKLLGVLKEIEEFKETPLYSSWSVHLIELDAVAQKLATMATFLTDFVGQELHQKRVCWFETTPSNTILVDARLDVSDVLQEHLFSKQRTSILCSATMTTGGSFSFLRQRLGLLKEQTRIQETVFHSPFDYATRVLFSVPTDFPDPSSSRFLEESIEAIAQTISVSRGSVFLLFTSYEMLQQCYEALSVRPLSQQYPFLKQGTLPRHGLLERFKAREGSVLFGTDSFWEGVDVPGEALRCVVLIKLPFSVPKEPLYEAYAEQLEAQGLNAFLDHSVPQAVIKFKQGFGRLMRKKQDRGCILCLDSRLIKKGYGKQFLNSLPPCRTYFAKMKEIFAEMQLFYDTVNREVYTNPKK